MLAGEARHIASDRAGFLGSHPEAASTCAAWNLREIRHLTGRQGWIPRGCRSPAGSQDIRARPTRKVTRSRCPKRDRRPSLKARGD